MEAIFMYHDWLMALLGGILIGASASVMLLFNGRVTGISGIIGGLLHPQKGDMAWRAAFIAGLLTTGLLFQVFWSEAFDGALDTPILSVVLAGLLVGTGTQLGSGCTSGHGVCGICRLSVRSITATLVFMLFGFMTVFVLRQMGVLS
jgi:uncharacterized protein